MRYFCTRKLFEIARATELNPLFSNNRAITLKLSRGQAATLRIS